MIEYWVYYAEYHSIQARVVAVFNDKNDCISWCQAKYGGYHDLGRNPMPSARDTKDAVGVGIITEVFRSDGEIK